MNNFVENTYFQTSRLYELEFKEPPPTPEHKLEIYWELFIPDNDLYLSAGFKKKIGYRNDELSNSCKALQKIIFKEDIPKVLRLYKKHIVSNGRIPYKIKVRYIHKNGSTVHFLLMGRIIEWAPDGSPVRMAGTQVNITSFIETEEKLLDVNARLQLILDAIEAGIWDWDLATGEEWWSPKMYSLLGYEEGEIPSTYHQFLNILLHPNDRAMVSNAIENHLKNGVPYRLEIRMQKKSGEYHWFETAGIVKKNEYGEFTRMVGSIASIDVKKKLQLQVEKREFLLQEVGKMAKIGGWEFDVQSNILEWSRGVYDLQEVEYTYQLSRDKALENYTPESRPILVAAVEEAIEYAKPYDIEAQMVTTKGKKIWVREIGKPVLDDDGKVIQLRGVFQNIDEIKQKELSLQSSMDVINEQNQRLTNFAHIVSHNLRSYTGNLELLTNHYENLTEEAEKKEYFEYIKSVSRGLSETILHLNDVVSIQTSIHLSKTTVHLQKLSNQILEGLEYEIEEKKVEIMCDFKECPTIEYVKSYMNSILLNFITNGIKYSHPDRNPVIILKTFIKNGSKVMTIQDNGRGIDLKKYGDKIFGMYKTFHKNPDARGIGLFITKNQIESLGGTISVQSEVNQGTTFKVIFGK